MSYEENKYSIKIQHYKIIQKIEMVMHENAVDAIINKNIIWPKSNNLALSKKNLDETEKKTKQTARPPMTRKSLAVCVARDTAHLRARDSRSDRVFEIACTSGSF